jgi:hypothetical protein
MPQTFHGCFLWPSSPPVKSAVQNPPCQAGKRGKRAAAGRVSRSPHGSWRRSIEYRPPACWRLQPQERPGTPPPPGPCLQSLRPCLLVSFHLYLVELCSTAANASRAHTSCFGPLFGEQASDDWGGLVLEAHEHRENMRSRVPNVAGHPPPSQAKGCIADLLGSDRFRIGREKAAKSFRFLVVPDEAVQERG